MKRKGQMKLGLMFDGIGANWGDWHHPARPLDASVNIDFYIRQAQLAEQGKFDFMFIPDSLYIGEHSSPATLNRLEPVTALCAVAMATSKLGLVATLSTTYSLPFTVARQLATLDHISKGRAGWNVVTSFLEGSATNYGASQHLAHRDRYRRAAEYVDVVKGLWDSWEDDAFVGDRANDRFFEPSKMHALNHAGEFFSVAGPLNIARSRQGRPVLLQAGSSNDGMAFAVGHVDVAFFVTVHAHEASNYREQIKRQMVLQGRDPASLRVIAGMRPVIGRTAAEVEARFSEFASYGSLKDALRLIGRPFNDHDFSQYDPDGPFPDVLDKASNSGQSIAALIVNQAREANVSLREFALSYIAPRTDFVGTPTQIADAMQRWFEQGIADGFMVFETLPGQLEAFIELVVPILQARGLHRSDYAGNTLREHLELPFPVNRYTAMRNAG